MTSKAPGLLIVEDEYLIRMLIEDMLDQIGFSVAAAIGSIAEAKEYAASGNFRAAILDVNVDGHEIFPVADVIADRGLPFVFVTGYGETTLPERFRGRPALQKPFQADRLKATLDSLLS